MVLKLDKLTDVSDHVSSNIDCMVVTFDVSKLDKSNEVRFVMSANMALIVVTLAVLKLVTLSDDIPDA